MSRIFYPRLAAINMRKNARTYIPYLLTCIATVMMQFIMSSLSCNSGLEQLRGSDSVIFMLEMGGRVTAVFALVFLFYTNSFLIKGRKKEFGLYNILGMEKRHISRILFYETLYTAAASLGIGLLGGILLNKLVYLGLLALMRMEIPLGFEISGKALGNTLLLFLVVFLLIYLNSLRQIHLAKPVELLSGGQTGEKEPKAKWLLALLGLLSLGGGYYIAVAAENPVEAISLFFFAVILVIIGTYLLFTAGSVALLKLLRKNKKYYYKTRHFISLSGMMYRMKQNAVGLANICILSTMVLVMISSTLSMYLGMEDMLHTRYPRSIECTVWEPDEDTAQQIRDMAAEQLEVNQAEPEQVIDYTALSFTALQQGDFFCTDLGFAADDLMSEMTYLADLRQLFVITWEDYYLAAGEEAAERPGEGEILFYINRGSYEPEVLKVFDLEFRIREKLADFIGTGENMASVTTTCYLVVRDRETLELLDEKQQEAYGEAASSIQYVYGFELEGEPEKAVAVYKGMKQSLSRKQGEPFSLECRDAEREWSLMTFGGFFFIGIFLGLMFIMATVLIIYYKQISEGYDDQKRFEIMQKVGLGRQEVKASIHSQVLTVFFLPLLTAGVHIVFAFPIIRRILALMNLINAALFAACTAGCFLAFALCYILLYLLTTRVYYRIVRWE